MNTSLAFVLGGGGARGALQVGALRALLEAGYKPDLLIGTSIGAINAAGLALWGVDLAGVDALERAFCDVAQADLMDPRLGRLALRALTGRPNQPATQRVADFLTSKGISPELRFGRLKDVRLGLVATDLETGEPVIYGQDPEQSVLEGVLASMALPPWFAPREKDGHIIVDGAALSNLPIEPALTLGATEIIALNLDDPRNMLGSDTPLDQSMSKAFVAMSNRHIRLETQLAQARGVAVRRIDLCSFEPTPIWDFDWSREMIATGYEAAVRQIDAWNSAHGPAWLPPARIAARQSKGSARR
jgi:NTE family protein